MIKKIKQLFCKHYFPGKPILILEDDFCRKYQITCAKCNYKQEEIFPILKNNPQCNGLMGWLFGHRWPRWLNKFPNDKERLLKTYLIPCKRCGRVYE